MWIALGIVAFIVFVVAFCLFGIAGDSDRRMEEQDFYKKGKS